jgi:hypothetical protein
LEWQQFELEPTAEPDAFFLLYIHPAVENTFPVVSSLTVYREKSPFFARNFCALRHRFSPKTPPSRPD